MEPTDRPLRPADPPERDEPLVELGPIVNRHGIRGEVRLLPHNPDSDAAATAAARAWCAPDGGG